MARMWNRNNYSQLLSKIEWFFDFLWEKQVGHKRISEQRKYECIETNRNLINHKGNKSNYEPNKSVIEFITITKQIEKQSLDCFLYDSYVLYKFDMFTSNECCGFS